MPVNAKRNKNGRDIIFLREEALLPLQVRCLRWEWEREVKKTKMFLKLLPVRRRGDRQMVPVSGGGSLLLLIHSLYVWGLKDAYGIWAPPLQTFPVGVLELQISKATFRTHRKSASKASLFSIWKICYSSPSRNPTRFLWPVDVLETEGRG